MRTTTKYGTLPTPLGTINIYPKEMMFWLYCPIKLKGMTGYFLPHQLKVFNPIVTAVAKDLGEDWKDKNIYVTAKRLYCSPGHNGQRPGWHSDGFLTDDLNYIWYDRCPTVFYESHELISFTADHQVSLEEMENLVETYDKSALRVYENKTLLKLDERNIHRTSDDFEPGMRTFVKISVSDHIYAHEGNSTNGNLELPVEYSRRSLNRNCPVTNKGIIS